jgi:hypothetical protein
MKYISYSLWGDNPIYNVGIIENAKQAKEIYPDWKMVVYYDNTTPLETIIDLIALDVECVNITSLGIYGMFWRFLAADKPDCEYAVFRDADSRLSVREKAAVDEWISSGKTLHVMRDHPGHGIPYGNDRLGILGGMWGIKSSVLPLTDMINKFKKDKNLSYGSDQTFLKTIYTVLVDDRFTNDDFFEKIPFTLNRINGRFIGERIDENDRCTHDDFFEKKPFPIKRENGRFIGERMNVNNEPLNNDYLAIR